MFGRSGRRSVKSDRNRSSAHSPEGNTAGGWGARVRRARRALVQCLEDRRLFSIITTLDNGTGPGAASVNVDAYGSFGLNLLGLTTQFGNFTVGNAGVVNKSSVYFSPLGQFLTLGDTRPLDTSGSTVGDLPFVEFDAANPSTATSHFELKGTDAAGAPFDYAVTLEQTLSGPSITPLHRFTTVDTLNQSVLTQKYSFTNLLGTATMFSAVRYFEPSDPTAVITSTSVSGTGSTVVSTGLTNIDQTPASLDSGRTLLVSRTNRNKFRDSGRTALDVANASDTLSIQSFGGTQSAIAVNFPGLDSQIEGANGIGSSFAGVIGNPANGILTEAGFAPALAQQNNLTVDPRQTVTYITTTTFAQGMPIQILNDNPPPTFTPVAVAGDFGFAAPAENYSFPQINGVIQPLTMKIVRNNGTSGPVSVKVVGVGGAVPSSAYTISPSVVTFDDGVDQATVTVTFDPSQVDVQPSHLLIGLAPITTTSTIAPPATTFPATVDIQVLPQTPAFMFGTLPTTATAGQGNLTFTILRSGNLNGPASVNFATTGGTAIAGTDYTAVNTRVDFADGESEKTVTVPILGGTQDNVTKSFGVVITGAPADGDTSNPTSIILTPSTATITLSTPDVTGPHITNVATVAGGRGITGIQLTFDEALRGIGGLSSFTLSSRSGEGAFGSAKLTNIPIVSASYDAVNKIITLIPKKVLALNTNYQITVRPDPSLTDLAGNTLNKAAISPANGPAFTAYFARATKVTYVDRSGDAVTLQMKGGSFELIRTSDGEAATVTLFGQDSTQSIFTGSIKKSKTGTGSAVIGEIRNADLATISLPANISVLNPPINTPTENGTSVNDGSTEDDTDATGPDIFR